MSCCTARCLTLYGFVFQHTTCMLISISSNLWQPPKFLTLIHDISAMLTTTTTKITFFFFFLPCLSTNQTEPLTICLKSLLPRYTVKLVMETPDSPDTTFKTAPRPTTTDSRGWAVGGTKSLRLLSDWCWTTSWLCQWVAHWMHGSSNQYK